MTRILTDVNAAAILLVEDHPGHEHVVRAVDGALRGDGTVLVYDYLPLRVQWVLTTRWDLDTVAARNAVTSLLSQPIEVVSASRETILRAYEVSAEKNHDVYDSFLLALAVEHDADELLTTDTDFETLCRDEAVEYRNPVPREVLAAFHAFGD